MIKSTSNKEVTLEKLIGSFLLGFIPSFILSPIVFLFILLMCFFNGIGLGEAPTDYAGIMYVSPQGELQTYLDGAPGGRFPIHSIAYSNERFDKVKIGMTENEVVDLLGLPLMANDERQFGGDIAWEYAHFVGPISRDGPLAWVGLVLFATGIALQAAAMWALRGLYTVRLGMQPGHRLVTSGPYRLVRHPGYLSYILAMTGIGLAMSSLVGLGLVVLIVPFLLRRIEREEEMLADEFGEKYRTYKQRTKRLIPLIY